MFINSSCKNDKNEPKKKEVPAQKVMQKENIEVPSASENRKDSINKKNAVLFLSKYGESNKETKVLIKTRLGNIKIKLFEDTPLHRASFIFLAKMGYFDTTCFYRVVPDFIIQGGESERLDTQKYKARYQRYKIPPEFKKNRWVFWPPN